MTISNHQFFFDKFNTDDLLISLAALSLLPRNHGKNWRLEKLSLQAVRQTNTSIRIANKDTLEQFLEWEYPADGMEDPPVNLYSDLIGFDGGNYLILPGITEGSAFILSNMLGAIFLREHTKLADAFKLRTYQASSFLLALSDRIIRMAGLNRYQPGEAKDRLIAFPDDNDFETLRFAVTFSNEEIKTLMTERSIPQAIVDLFILDQEDPALQDISRQDSPIVFKPLKRIGDDLIVISPSTISFALTEFIRDEAGLLNCTPTLNTAYHHYLWNNLQPFLTVLGFHYLRETNAQLDLKPSDGIAVYSFDDDKRAVIHLEYPGNSTSLETIIMATVKAGFKVLNIGLISSLGETFFYMNKPVDGSETTNMEASELEVIAKTKGTDAHVLYQFAQAEEGLQRNFPSLASFIDRYHFYDEHSQSFYFSDEEALQIPVILPGYGASLLAEAKVCEDRHLVPLPQNGLLGLAEVVRREQSSPVYFIASELAQGELYLLVEGFPQPVWIKSRAMARNAVVSLRQMVVEMADALAYWLWQVQPFLRSKMTALGAAPLIIEFEFDQDALFAQPERDYTREPYLINYFKSTFEDRVIRLTIPARLLPYLYGADNEGERVLTEVLLRSFNLGLSDSDILDAVDQYAPLGIKKKLMILDSADNMMRDPKGLVKHRYIQDHAVSRLLDRMGEGVSHLPIGKRYGKEEQNTLAIFVVDEVLWPMLFAALSKYDSNVLIRRLIRLNESLTSKREYLRIHTATRIACYVSEKKQIADLQEEMEKMNRTTIAIRCLLEQISARPYYGTEPVSTETLDELIAIMDQLISWGSVSDQVYFGLVDMNLGILPSGRIGSDKSALRKVFDPFHAAKTAENVRDAQDTFAQTFPQGQEQGLVLPVPEDINLAFQADYGLSLEELIEFINVLIVVGYQQDESCAAMPLLKLHAEMIKGMTEPFSAEQFKYAINYLSLKGGAEVDDEKPWRFNRRISFLRKPLIIAIENGIETVFWGIRHLLQSKIYLSDQLHSGRFRSSEGAAVRGIIGGLANERGRRLVADLLSNLDLSGLIMDKEVTIKPGGKLENMRDIGDVDIMLIDPEAKVLYSLECKAMSPSRNIREMSGELNKLFGFRPKKGWVQKHMDRHKWLEQHLAEVAAAYHQDLEGYAVKSFFVTGEQLFAPHSLLQDLPLPFVTLYDFAKKGNRVLTAH